MAILEARNVSKVYRRGTGAEVRALCDVSLSIARGEFVLLTGASASGKSTLLAVLGALERPTTGQVLFDGMDVGACSDARQARARRQIGFVFQNFSLIPGLPVWENVTYPLVPCGLGRARRRARAAELLHRLGLADKLLVLPEELCGGEQQRVAVARALAGQPALVIADEPTSNLDPVAATALIAQFQEIHRAGTTLILSSHDPNCRTLAATVYTLEGGRLRKSSQDRAPGSDSARLPRYDAEESRDRVGPPRLGENS